MSHPPARPTPGHRAPDPATTPPGAETVLLVEDEPAVRLLAALVLRKAGYAVLEAGTGEEALAAAERHAGPLHLLVTDVGLPDVGGRELAARLAAARPGLRVLLTSGYADDPAARDGTPGPPAEFLGKPFTPTDLTRKVREVLDRAR